MKHRKLLFIIALGAFLYPFVIQAQQVQITGLDDISFGTYSGSGDVSLTAGVCVYKSSGTDRYFVTADGSGSGGSYSLSNGGGATVSYSFEWKPAGSSKWTSHGSGQAKRYSGANLTSQTCSGTTNADYRITIKETDLAVFADSYSGSVTVVIEPA